MLLSFHWTRNTTLAFYPIPRCLCLEAHLCSALESMVGFVKWSKTGPTSQVVLVILLLKRKEKKGKRKTSRQTRTARPSLCQEQDWLSLLGMTQKAALGRAKYPTDGSSLPPTHPTSSPAHPTRPPRPPLLAEDGHTRHRARCCCRSAGLCPAWHPGLLLALQPPVLAPAGQGILLPWSPRETAALPPNPAHPLLQRLCARAQPALDWDENTTPEARLAARLICGF